jgi:sugar lactone lactonase YvrE
MNIAPIATIAGSASHIGQPTGIALDAHGNIYVADQASTACAPALAHCPAILKFAAGASGAATPTIIAGAATKLFAPTDVKVDSNGLIYVADSTSAGASVIYIYAATASGNVAPTATFTSPGTAIGLGLSP